GTFQKTNSWGTTTVWAHFNNLGGVVNVQTGNVDFRSGGPNASMPGTQHPAPMNATQAAGDPPASRQSLPNYPSPEKTVPPRMDRSEGVSGASKTLLHAPAGEAFAELFGPETLIAWGAAQQP